MPIPAGTPMDATSMVEITKSHHVQTRLIHWILLSGILLLAAYLRLANLTDNPGWYSDEGSNLIVASNLQHGQMAYMALGQSTLLVSRMIVFEEVLAASLKLFGGGIDTLRTLTGLLGVLTVLTLYICVRRVTHNSKFALLAASLLTIYPQAIVYSRFGFSYNLLPPLLLIIWLGLAEYWRTGQRTWLALSALSVGVGTVSDLWMLAVIAPFVIVVLIKNWRDLFWSLPLIGLFFGIYAVFMISHAPEAFALDVQFVLFRVSNVSLIGQLQNVTMNYTVLLSQDFWMPCAVVGLLILTPTRLRYLTLGLIFLLLIILGRTIALYNLSAYYMVPLLPFIAFGTAALIYNGAPFVWQQLRDTLRSKIGRAAPLISASVCILIIAVPFLESLILDLDHVQNGIPTAIDPFLINPEEARQAAQFINANASPTDLVIINPAMSWLVNTRTADIQMSIAATGLGNVHYPSNIPSDRWLYDPRIEQARYVVLDNLWRSWGANTIAGMDNLLLTIEQWPVAFHSGNVTVYRNPILRK
jgi:hypothetical protein